MDESIRQLLSESLKNRTKSLRDKKLNLVKNNPVVIELFKQIKDSKNVHAIAELSGLTTNSIYKMIRKPDRINENYDYWLSTILALIDALGLELTLKEKQ